MKERLARIQTRIDELSLRERVMVFLVAIGMAALLWQEIAMGPVEARQRELLQRLERIRGEITAYDAQAQAIIQGYMADPDAENRRRLAEHQAQLAAVESRLQEAVAGVIEPRQMARALEEVLVRHQDLTLLRVENLGAEPLLEAAAEGAGAAGVYRHSLRLEFEGEYVATVAYLHALKSLPWSFYWDGIEIAVLDYPRARIAIRVHTLSLNEGWIGV